MREISVSVLKISVFFYHYQFQSVDVFFFDKHQYGDYLIISLMKKKKKRKLQFDYYEREINIDDKIFKISFAFFFVDSVSLYFPHNFYLFVCLLSYVNRKKHQFCWWCEFFFIIIDNHLLFLYMIIIPKRKRFVKWKFSCEKYIIIL